MTHTSLLLLAPVLWSFDNILIGAERIDRRRLCIPEDSMVVRGEVRREGKGDWIEGIVLLINELFSLDRDTSTLDEDGVPGR